MGDDPPEDDRSADLDYPDRLRITVATGDQVFDAAVADAAAAEAGGSSRGEAVRAFDSLSDLRELLTPGRLEVLRAVHERSPESISALARRLDRPYAVVHEDLQTLAKYDVVRFDDGPRGARRPSVPYEEIRVDVPLVGEFDVPDGLEWDGADGTARSG